MTLPASQSFPVGARITSTGAIAFDNLVMTDTSTGLPWKLTVANGTVTLVASPGWADLPLLGFTSWTSLGSVGSWAAVGALGS